MRRMGARLSLFPIWRCAHLRCTGALRHASAPTRRNAIARVLPLVIFPLALFYVYSDSHYGRASRFLNSAVCDRIVENILDVPPIRSPQAVHSVIAKKVYGTSLVEIGTRNGDGMSCFASFAYRASAVEIVDKYCVILEERKARESRNFEVQCVDFKEANLDADYITWWQQAPITNTYVLRTLRDKLLNGKIRRTASALLLFDEKWPKDMKSLVELSNMPINMSTTAVKFDEEVACREYARKLGVGSSESGFDCTRSFGRFFIGEVKIANIPERLPSF